MVVERILISYRDALAQILSSVPEPQTESIPIVRLQGRVLAEPAIATSDVPRFDNSAVDGYGICEDDRRRLETQPQTLELAGTVRAGDSPKVSILPGQCIQILTGAPLPASVSAMVMQEDCEITGTTIHIKNPTPKEAHFRFRADDVSKGDIVCAAGQIANPATISAMATAGIATVTCYKRPEIGLLITGNELRQPGQELGDSGIFESNSHGLSAAVSAMGLPPLRIVRAKDDRTETVQALQSMLDLDIILTTGGVSVGEFDVVRPSLEELGCQTHFWGVAIKPGKPFYFGQFLRGPAVFGLPGNPLSTLITFYTLVRPYLLARIGYTQAQNTRECQLGTTITKKAGRLEFIPCSIEGSEALPWVERASHRLSGLGSADGLIIFPEGASELRKGDTISVLALNWGLK